MIKYATVGRTVQLLFTIDRGHAQEENIQKTPPHFSCNQQLYRTQSLYNQTKLVLLLAR
jgi:hypothetical protein